ncbi:ComEC/Rec2 family competence protein [Methylocystis bryophila]|uniref:ComEC/Rec2 family competence protein n=1 Tax=Methylocystis bryophila TaxID=655015 RepID=UPI001FD8D992|nr:ComEC/Rec2 family competence protein [Methylocystis bryophila]
MLIGQAAGAAGFRRLPDLPALALRLGRALRLALDREIALRRLFLWTPVAAGAGALLYFGAEREPSLWAALALLLTTAGLAFAARTHPRLFTPLVVFACLSGGFFSAAWRAARVEAPTLTRVGVGELTGFVEELDPRREGARFLLQVASAEGLPDGTKPARVRLTLHGEPHFSAGDFVVLKARLMPPAQASLPAGYDFARDAYFQRLGGVGNVLGRVETMPPPDPASFSLRFFAGIDRFRNALAARVYERLQGDTGAIAAAMVSGKRDYLSDDAKELIRKAGIFHIVTISGIQMSLVAGVFFVGLRRLFALSRTLALNYPIKKWAAALAILGAVLYDLATGSRVGTERALVMTLVMLVAILFDRPAMSMRNLAFAAFFVILFEPEALLGASFQLSFAAVAALIAVYETRADARFVLRGEAQPRIGLDSPWERFVSALSHVATLGPAAALLTTFCATLATASFMANDFHELSPYVLVGNPLTLAVIEFFAVPCALLGAALYPLGLDGLLWMYLGLGIELVLKIAHLIAAAPGAGLPVKSFAPSAIFFLTLALLSVVLWRSALMRLTAVPFLLIGLFGAAAEPPFDLAVAPSGETAALRVEGGELALMGRRSNDFAAEQWLRADADPRTPKQAGRATCDDLGCVAKARGGQMVALVTKREALLEDCAKADVLIAPFNVPQACGAKIVIDRSKLAETGAATLRFADNGAEWTTARARGEDRPWSKAPKARPAPPRSVATEAKREEAAEE